MAKIMAMRMLFQQVELMSFHRDMKQVAKQISDSFPDIYVRVWNMDVEGQELVERKQVAVYFNGKEVKP